MAFCTKCGKKLREGDRFCYYCGEPARDEKRETEATESVQNVEAEKEELTRDKGKETEISVRNMNGKKKKLPLIIGAAVLFLFLIAGAGVLLWLGKDSGTMEDHTEYVNYSNDAVCFSVDYPEGYMVTEPNINNVLITDGENADFQVSIEYAYSTVSDCAIYSAADFAEQVENDPKVLTDWLGTEDVETAEVVQTSVSGRNCYEYDFEFQMNEVPHTGKLYIFDSDGEFGCYSYLCVINENAENAELYKLQSSAMEESFQITGTCQAEGYTCYRYEEPEMQFMVRDETMGKTEESGGSVVVYPVEHIYTEANIWIEETSYEADEADVTTVLEKKCRYYFNEKEQTRYTSQPMALEYGRYAYTGVDVQYYDGGKHYTLSAFAFVYDGTYWAVIMKSTDAYYEAAAQAVSDILFSLKMGDEMTSKAAVSSQQTDSEKEEIDTDEKQAKTVSRSADAGTRSTAKRLAAEIAEEIEGKSGYTTSAMKEPLGVVDDFNGDGIQEFLAVYEVKNGSRIDVMYELWSLSGADAVQIESDVLFTEVGGNQGVIGIVESDGTVYLAIERKEPEGENFNNYYMYFPWDAEESRLDEAAVYMESHGTYGSEEKGRYILGDTKTDKSQFDERYDDFSNWIYKIDPLSGADGAVMSFEDIKA